MNTAVCESLLRPSGLRNNTVIPECSDMDNKQSEYCGVLFCAGINWNQRKPVKWRMQPKIESVLWEIVGNEVNCTQLSMQAPGALWFESDFS